MIYKDIFAPPPLRFFGDNFWNTILLNIFKIFLIFIQNYIFGQKIGTKPKKSYRNHQNTTLHKKAVNIQHKIILETLARRTGKTINFWKKLLTFIKRPTVPYSKYRNRIKKSFPNI